MSTPTVHYSVVGSGPVLLILQGGANDADGTAELAARLRDRYTIVTYDRRGLSRSRSADPAGARIETHADDVISVLRTVTDRPARMVGTSFGAVIGLAVLTREPDLVSRLVAHEPPVTAVLSEAERGPVDDLHHQVLAVRRKAGSAAALKLLMSTLGLNPDDREPDVQPPAPSKWSAQNLECYLDHDLPALMRYMPDLDSYRAQAVKLLPAIGESSGHIAPARCARQLAGLTGAPLVTLPGGHGGLLSRPRASAKCLDELLSQTDSN